MKKQILGLVFMIAVAVQPVTGQNSVVEAFERGRRDATVEANSAAQRALLAAQADLLRAQTQALQQQSSAYTAQELVIAMSLLEQRHPDWKEFEQQMATIGKLLLPVKGLTSYDYVLALYLLAKEKKNEQQIEGTAVLAQFSIEHPDWHQYEQTMTQLAALFPARDGESPTAYLGRLYDLARQK